MINLMLIISSIIHVVHSMKNGTLAIDSEFNYVVSIRRMDVHCCTGVIIDEIHIITVAHPVAGIPIKHLEVFAGDIAINLRFISLRPVKDVYLHPGFKERVFLGQSDDRYFENDIALLRLEQRFIWSDSLGPISLMDMEYNWGYCFDCVLISWYIPQEYRRKMTLSWKLIKLMGDKVNQRWSRYLGKDQKLFSDFFGTAAIGWEDLGSPIVCGNFMAGLVVNGEQHAISGKPSILMPIAPYLGFINEVIHDGLFDVAPGEFPYVTSIWYDGAFACGGFIVDATHIATAGHCVANVDAATLRARVGDPPPSTEFSPVLWLSITNVMLHPGYKMEYTHVSPWWYIDEDFAILTLAEPITWSRTVNQVPLTDSHNLFEGQLCEVLRWKYEINEITGEQTATLKASRVLLVNSCLQILLDPSTQSQGQSIWGIFPYPTSISDVNDAGNPIVCEGNPVGFLVQVIPMYGGLSDTAAKFLKIRPYIEFMNNFGKPV